MMLQIVSILIIIVYIRSTYMCHIYFFLTNQNQALVTLCLHAYLDCINCDLYAAYWWPMIGNKLYSILFYSILGVSQLRGHIV